MKSVIIAICLLVPLVIIFVVIDRKDFYSGDDLAVQQETVTRKPPTVTTLKPVEQPAETKPVEVKPTETKPVETKPVIETKPTETRPAESVPVAKMKPADVKPTETKPVVETKTAETMLFEEKLAPAAIPVITAEEAEKLNVEAFVLFEKLKKIRAKERQRLERGYGLAFSEQFKDYKKVSLSKTNEEQLSKKGYDLDEFKKREIPNVWSLDYSTIPSDANFQITNDGYTIDSAHDVIRFTGQRLNGMRSSFLFELTIKNNSDKESEITFGVHNFGILKNGYKHLISETLHSKEEKTIEAELSVFEQLASIAPTISVKGNITLSDLTIYRKDHDDFSIIEGEIVERSTLPDPKDTDYPDCRYTAHFMGNAILSGMPCNKELALSIDGFLNKKILPTNSLKAGDKIKCAIVSVDSIPEELASIQEADDLSLFTLDSYLVTTYAKITSYTDFTRNYNALVPFKSDSFEFKSVFDQGFNTPIPDRVREAQKKQIEQDLENANKMISYLKENGEEIEERFQKAWDVEKRRYSDGYNTIKSKNGIVFLYWRNIDNSFWCLPPTYKLISKTPHELPQDKINAVVAFKDFLESNGIQLIVSLVPDRYAISSRVINRDFRDIPELQVRNLCQATF